MLSSRVGTGAAVRTVHLAAPAADGDQASAGAQSALTALLPSWKAAVPLPLSRSMRFDTRVGGGAVDRALLPSPGSDTPASASKAEATASRVARYRFQAKAEVTGVPDGST